MDLFVTHRVGISANILDSLDAAWFPDDRVGAMTAPPQTLREPASHHAMKCCDGCVETNKLVFDDVPSHVSTSILGVLHDIITIPKSLISYSKTLQDVAVKADALIICWNVYRSLIHKRCVIRRFRSCIARYQRLRVLEMCN